MEGTSPHLERAHGDIEQGTADVLAPHFVKHAAPHGSAPRWIVTFESRRPRWLIECVAEAMGVFIYVFAGLGASASFYFSSADKISGYGDILTVGLSYAAGIAFGVLVAAPVSGGHLSPAFTVAFVLFKGFPLRKAWRYILSQLVGGFLATLSVYGQYKQAFDEIHFALVAEGAPDSIIFSPNGPAGILAIFPSEGAYLGWVLLNELICTVVLSILIFSIIDRGNIFVSLPLTPLMIRGVYAVIIWAFASPTLALNLARDLPGRMVCACMYGTQCFTQSPKYTAIAAVTSFPGTIIGAFIQTLFLSDTARLSTVSEGDESNNSSETKIVSLE